MTWTYRQHTGEMLQDGKLVATGYSGHGAGLNNPAMQTVRGVGPLPQGRYRIGEPKSPIDHLGAVAMPLEPCEGNVMFGRSAFFIHGDNPAMNHTASDGCIILARVVRNMIAASADRDLTVVAPVSISYDV